VGQTAILSMKKKLFWY